MRRQRPRPVLFVLSACLLAALALARPARAAVQTLTLKDGSTVTGEIVEYVVNDHVTVKIAPGERLRIEWSRLSTPVSAPHVDTVARPPLHVDTAAPSPDGAVEAPSVEPQPPPGSGGPGRRLMAGITTGFPSPLGYMAIVVDGFPFPAGLLGLQQLGFEVAVAMPIANEPVTFAESLLTEYPISTSNFGFGASAGVAQSLAKVIVPGDHPGVVSTALFGANLGYRLPFLTLRAGAGGGSFINGGYCKPHPEACPSVATGTIPIFFYGQLSVLATLDFDHRSR